MAAAAAAPKAGSAAVSGAVANGGSPVFIGQSVIPLVNKLQDVFSQLGSSSAINLPQVAVVGSQSSGKSSVLEGLVGRDFLPRGSDICTRRPLVLQLIQTPGKVDEKSEIVEWGEFLHAPGRRFTDFSMIRKEIEAETERELGSNKGISDKQIRLKIFSPNVLTITLVDLPGITKVPVGDQPSDIEARIRTMIFSYIKHETCIILAISPANADLANSDALQMARSADPDGSRTIGVITKLDIMDRGTDARDLLMGSVIPLRLGYIGVVNRSQEDILANKSVRDAVAYEENFFRSKSIYHGLADRCGIAQLAKRLNHILIQHIKTILPDMKARINVQMVAHAKELASYGELTDSKSGQGALLLQIITRYSQGFAAILDGKNEEMSTTELSGGARLHYIFQNIFVKSLDEVDPCDEISDEDIRTAIQNATGPKSIIFVPEVPFEVLVRRQISQLLDPSLQCARFIYDELVKISHRCESHDLQRFPVLHRRVEEVMSGFLREGLAPAETMICHLIEMEMDYINTSHPAFIGGNKAVDIATHHIRVAKASFPPKDPLDSKESSASVAGQGAKSRTFLGRNPVAEGLKSASARAESSVSAALGTVQTIASGGSWGISSFFGGNDGRPSGKESVSHKSSNESIGTCDPMGIQLKQPPSVLRAADILTDQESIEIAVTKLLIKSYFDIVRKKVQDSVPKAVMHFLVNHTKRELQSVFIRKLYREHLFEDMLQEREDIAAKRKRCKEVLLVLQQAARILEELPLDCESSSRPGLTDATGLPSSLTKSSSLSAVFSFMTNDDASWFSNPDESRKSGPSGDTLPLFNSGYSVNVNASADFEVEHPFNFA